MIKHKGTQELITNRLRLRRFVLSDAKSMFKIYATDERVTKFLSWKPYENVNDVEAFLSTIIEEYARDNVHHWAIEFDNEVIGSVSTISVDEKNCSCEIGYCLGYKYWNKGFTTEAVLTVIDYLFNTIKVHRIMAKHDVENPASGVVMKRCNMLYEGKLREYYLRHDGTYSDSLVYGILEDDYRRTV